MIWGDHKVVAFDFETSGSLPEYALQPWRWTEGRTTDSSWLTSVSLIRYVDGDLVPDGSQLFPTKAHLEAMLQRVIDNDWYVITWNGVFDIGWVFAVGLGHLAHQIKWLDAMLLWRHLEIEPEYEFQGNRGKRKSYRLKPDGMKRWLLGHEGYEEDVDYHATDEESLKKLQKYNDRDSVYTWIIGKLVWAKLIVRVVSSRDSAVR